MEETTLNYSTTMSNAKAIKSYAMLRVFQCQKNSKKQISILTQNFYIGLDLDNIEKNW